MSNNKNNKDNSSKEQNQNIIDKNAKTSIINGQIKRTLSMVMQSSNPIVKLSEKNIDNMIEVEKETIKCKNDDRKDERKFILILAISLTVIFVLLILSILIIFKDNTEFLKIVIPPIISFAVGTIGGGFGGYGVGYRKGRNSDE
ncbi:hypothetical protein [Brachyspira murdochii]|uniref:Uncharacterized protein n=1 Tax=Brachyspira murdochii (strain ATCC 51284 / DSM 12563 / 56-150) TaxID=526224 RepID=D5U9S3_BRAM5|nr:hypothetical protein [Brachyspira murdochii]ADG71446.1 hypothetical protein Bmur_1356 [Brachyspira murdochii DSM 12563]